MEFLKSIKALFVSTPKAEPSYPEEEYKGFTITPTPLSEGGQFRVSGLVTKDDKSHQFFRADMLPSADACATETIRKAKLTIDQIGDGIFG